MAGIPGDVVNYRGDTLSDADYQMVTGRIRDSPFSSSRGDAYSLQARASLFANWLTGGKPPPIDPSISLARSAALSGVYQRAGAGRGVSGLFGLGKILGSPAPGVIPADPGSPMQSGVPYSVPPIPGLFKPGVR